MRAYVINLDRSADRRRHMRRELQKTGLDYELIRAIDARDLDLEDSSLVSPDMAAESPFPGTIACPLSHLVAYRKILVDGCDEALVLEDDVMLPPDLGRIVTEVAVHLEGADVVLLNYGCRPPGPLNIAVKDSASLGSSRQLAFPLDVRQLLNGGAYVITREACQRMVEGLLPIRATADAWGYFYERGVVDRVRCVLPQPVPKCPKFESTIGMYSLGSGLKARLAGPVVRHKVPGVQQLIVRRRRRIMSLTDRTELVDMPFVAKPSRIG